MKKLKVLISAYACHPHYGSEEGVGWGWVRAIARHHHVWVLTSDRHRADLEKEISSARGRPDQPRFIFIPEIPRLGAVVRLQHLLWPPLFLMTYERIWQPRAFQAAVAAHRLLSFDLVHQLTYVGFRVPGQLWRLGIPFVWGPIGGLEQTNLSLLPPLGVRALAYYAGRNLLNWRDKHTRPLVRKAMKAAHGGLIAATSGIQSEILRLYSEESEVITEVGLPPGGTAAESDLAHRRPDEPLRLMWVGHLQARKALPLFFHAALETRCGASANHDTGPSRAFAALDWSLDVFGDGSEARRWRRMAETCGLSPRITWHGRQPRAAVLTALGEAHALVVTSVYDLTSTVVVEALAAGVPVVCPDHCGFRDAVSDECGIRCATDSAASLVSGLSAALHRLHADEEGRQRMARNALVRARDFAWEIKARKVDEIYRRVIGAPSGNLPEPVRKRATDPVRTL